MTGSGHLPHLRQVRPPPSSGPASRQQGLPSSSSTTIPLPSTSRCRPASQTRPRTTAAQNPKTTRNLLRRGARRRRLLPPPTTQRPPGGPPRSDRSIPALGYPRGDVVRRRRSPDSRLCSGKGRGGRDDWSNLTSGPRGPTVSDPRARPHWISESVKSRVRIPYPESVFCTEAFPFFCVILKTEFD